MIFDLVILASVGLVIVGTLWSIQNNLQIRAIGAPRRFVIFVSRVGMLAFGLGILLAITLTIGHPTALLLVILTLLGMASLRRLRQRSSSRLINRWLQLAVKAELPMPELLNQLAACSPREEAAWFRRTSTRLFRGETVSNAVRESGLPLSGATLTALPTAGLTATPTESRELAFEKGSKSDNTDWLLASRQQLGYVFASLLIAVAIKQGFRLLTSELNEISEELLGTGNYDEFQATMATYEAIDGYANLAVLIVCCWIALALMLRWLPGWLVRWIPWFGKSAIQDWRCDILETLRSGLALGQSESQVLEATAKLAHSRWTRSRCLRASRLVSAGTPTPEALRRSGVITHAEQKWLQLVISNHTLLPALDKLTGDVRRHLAMRWQLRLSWFVPCGLVLISGFVLMQCYAPFQLLTLLISDSSLYQ